MIMAPTLIHSNSPNGSKQSVGASIFYQDQVLDFKTKWCNENDLVIDIIRNQLSSYFIAPILDVGAGMGDIAVAAFPEKSALCMDINTSAPLSGLSARHRWYQGDFLSFQPDELFQTLFISHTQQFLDSDLQQLNSKVHEVGARHVVLVENRNTGLFGDIIRWVVAHYPDANPEVILPSFPTGYALAKEVNFTAQLQCPDFATLAQQIGYLAVVDLDKHTPNAATFLQSLLGDSPTLAIEQRIAVFSKV